MIAHILRTITDLRAKFSEALRGGASISGIVVLLARDIGIVCNMEEADMTEIRIMVLSALIAIGLTVIANADKIHMLAGAAMH